MQYSLLESSFISVYHFHVSVLHTHSCELLCYFYTVPKSSLLLLDVLLSVLLQMTAESDILLAVTVNSTCISLSKAPKALGGGNGKNNKEKMNFLEYLSNVMADSLVLHSSKQLGFSSCSG